MEMRILRARIMVFHTKTIEIKPYICIFKTSTHKSYTDRSAKASWTGIRAWRFNPYLGILGEE